MGSKAGSQRLGLARLPGACGSMMPLETRIPHVAFIARQLASKNQFELPRALRSLDETRNCKLILTAAGVGSHDLRELKRAGLSHFLRRPINLEPLARAVDEVNARPFLFS
jgi:hypothetical protein